MSTLLEIVARGLGTGGVYALLGLGFVIVYKGTDVINFAQPGLMVLGGFFVSLFSVGLGFGFWPGTALGMVVAALIGAAAERVAMRPMVGEPPFSAAMVTVGLFFVMLMLARRLIGSDIMRVGDPWGLSSFHVAGAQIFQADVAKIAVALLAILLTGLFYKFSRAGLAMRATASDQEAAFAQGVNVGRVFGLSWALAGALGALAGALVSTGGVGLQAASALVALKALPAIVLGGLDSIRGAVVGGFTIGLVEMFSRVYQPVYAPGLGSNFDQVVPYIVMLLVLMVRPHGLFGTVEVERI